MIRYEPWDDTLDCQDCGDVLKVLTSEEKKRVAHNPENYILYCRSCGEAEMKRLEQLDRPW